MRSGIVWRAFAIVAIVVVAMGPVGASASSDLTPGGGAVVAADALNLRGGPGTLNPVVAVLPGGTSLRLLAGPVDDVWWRVTDGERVGYVHGDWLQSGPVPSGTDAFDVDLDVPIHRQLTRVWCDPADLQTWVEFDQKQTLGESYSAQQRFWDWELSHNAGFTIDQWDASPYAVASAAHQWLPNRGFNHFIYDDSVQAMATVAWVLANPAYREPAIANIWWGDHYVLVRGVRATADPYASYPNAKILGVYVMDPNQGRPSWLGQDRYIPLDTWITRYLTPVSYLTPGSGVPGDVWQGKYVTIQRDWTTNGPTLTGRMNASPAQYQAG